MSVLISMKTADTQPKPEAIPNERSLPLPPVNFGLPLIGETNRDNFYLYLSVFIYCCFS